MNPTHARNKMVGPADLYAALSVVTAEVSHEVVHTMAFLRYLVELARNGVFHDEEAITFARKEIARLERLLSNLRRFKQAAPHAEVVRVNDIARQVLASIKNLGATRPHQGELDIPPDLMLRSDPMFFTQILRHLLEYAQQAAGPDGSFGLRVVREPTRNEVPIKLIVWDNGPIVDEAMKAALFLPWPSSTRDDHPIRLAIAHNLVRGLGWLLTYERTADRNEYRIVVPATAVEVPSCG